MSYRQYWMKHIRETVEPKAVEDVCEDLLDGGGDRLTKQSISILLHRYVRDNITQTDQNVLKSPEITIEDREGGHLDRIVLLTSMFQNSGLVARILKISNQRNTWYTSEVLVENESEIQSIGVDAEKDYRFRESTEKPGMFWRPADPELCSRAGKIEGLEDRDLIEKKSDGVRRYYDWVQISDRCAIRP